ncbi:hypothetical protein Pan216_18270 [Planctomycetes bacterium Pan216]|uniref:Uncharacterized protein n=1 Tax=Kolteria novifilia TaxID=2527975 RepID=A0A518B1W9_9BACT|nr:hypothetical protein Pan216_18270 [Planctomycetes bacterium Pan216]
MLAKIKEENRGRIRSFVEVFQRRDWSKEPFVNGSE